MATRIISVMNQKGGVGKTTTVLNLGAALAQAGRNVLLVDLDPQANLTHGLGTRAQDLSTSVYELLTNQKCDVRPIIKELPYEGLFLIPSHIDLSGAEIELVPMMGRETRLKKSLTPVIDVFDYILIDCLPSLSLLTVNAMVASTEILVPLIAHPFALEGLGKLFEITEMLRDALNPDLKLTGVLVTLYDSRTNVSRETLQILNNDNRLAPHMFNTLVRSNIKIAESQKDGIPVIHFEPGCTGSKAYKALCQEVIEMETGCLASEAQARIEARGGTGIGETTEALEENTAEPTTTTEPTVLPETLEEPLATENTATESAETPDRDPETKHQANQSSDVPPADIRGPSVMPRPWKEEPASASGSSRDPSRHRSKESFRNRLAHMNDLSVRPRLNLVKSEQQGDHAIEEQKEKDKETA